MGGGGGGDEAAITVLYKPANAPNNPNLSPQQGCVQRRNSPSEGSTNVKTRFIDIEPQM